MKRVRAKLEVQKWNLKKFGSVYSC